MSFLRVFTVAALLAAPCVAGAADLPVRYTAQEKPLKAAIAGTMLTFQLYSDALCTSSVYTTSIAIENVDLIGRIKPFNPKNAAKKANSAEIRATLTAVPPTASLYLKVTGTGVTPVGGACQAQASGLSAATGPGVLVVKDSTSATVGVFDGTSGAIYDDGGAFVKFSGVSTSGFSQAPFFATVFTSNDCTGTPLVGPDPSLVRNATVVGTTAYYPPATGASLGINSLLAISGTTPFVNQAACDATFGMGTTTFVAPNGCCEVVAFTSPAGPVLTIDVSGFVPPFSVQ